MQSFIAIIILLVIKTITLHEAKPKCSKYILNEVSFHLPGIIPSEGVGAGVGTGLDVVGTPVKR